MRITILCVGKCKETFYTQAAAEYAKRLSRYVKLEMLEAADEKAPEELSESQMEKVREKEGERLLARIKEGSYVIALAIQGEALSSEELAARIERLGVEGKSHLVFVIGGSLGLSKKVLERADMSLSFSRMTFPHPLMRVILLEQIYRSYRIISHEPYHK